MLYEASQPQVTPESSVQYLCFLPQSSSLVSSKSQGRGKHATPRECAWPFRCTAPQVAGNRSTLSVPASTLSRFCTRNTGYLSYLWLLPLKTTFQLFKDSAIGLLCTKRLGRVAPLLGGLGFPAAEAGY